MSKRADPDFRIRTGFFRHPKTRRLQRRLGADGVLALMQLWAWAVTQRTDGDLSGLADEDIEDVVDWHLVGEPGALIQALADLRWLDGEEGKRQIHGWAEHQPYVVNRSARVERARRGAAARWGNQQPELPLPTPDAAPHDATSMPEGCFEHAGSNAPNPTHTHSPTGSARAYARAREEEPAAEAARALKAAGCPDANAADPVLQGVVAAGSPPLAGLVELAHQHPGKRLTYLIAAYRGRQQDASGVSATGPPPPLTSSGPHGGPSPPKQPEDPVENARRYAANLVRLGRWTTEEADAYVRGVQQKQQGE